MNMTPMLSSSVKSEVKQQETCQSNILLQEDRKRLELGKGLTPSLNPCRRKERVQEPRIFATQCSQQLICPPTQCPNSQAPVGFLVGQVQTAQD
ncbi:hypothetical protein MC885_020606 [Smutsia gigantea]|nr:hypothetical protein MC885_020606 [Smutsia gigantea]